MLDEAKWTDKLIKRILVSRAIAMAPLKTDPITQLAFSVFENRGVFALLLGSGLSKAAGIPTGWEITLDLIHRIGTAQGVKAQQDWAKWYKTETGDEPSYSDLLQDLAASPDERRSILHSYIEPTPEDIEEGRRIPTAAHHAIAGLVQAGYIRVIITTNFDRLIETALRERGIEPTVVASLDALLGAEPLVHSKCYILKLHGDYKDARILNTNDELKTYHSKYNRLLSEILDDHGLVVCGWSGEWDTALRSALLRSPSRRYPMYWATRSSLSSTGQGIAEKRKARIVQIDNADQFFTALHQRVETLEQTQSQNPQSVDLLLSSVKRYLAKPEYRIQLDELFAQETDRLVQQLDDPEFAPQGNWSAPLYRERVAKYEASAEPLAKMAGALGRWGEGSDFPIIVDVIRTLQAQSLKIGGGLKPLLDIRGYPAVLVLTAYGIGLVRTSRWTTLHDLFCVELAREDHNPKRLVARVIDHDGNF